MLKLLSPTLVLLFCVVSFPSPGAADSCDRYRDTQQRNYCLTQGYVKADRDLNTVYQALRGRLGSQAREDLKHVQRAWIQYRDSRCESAPGQMDVECNLEVTRDRTAYLRDRLSECKRGRCDRRAILTESW